MRNHQNKSTQKGIPHGVPFHFEKTIQKTNQTN
jgi:hypothetical protein